MRLESVYFFDVFFKNRQKQTFNLYMLKMLIEWIFIFDISGFKFFTIQRRKQIKMIKNKF